MPEKKIYILDVSGYIFRAYFAIPPMSNPSGEPTHALYGFIRSILKLFKEFGPEHIVAVFDGPDNKKQRLEIYEKYKATRTKINADLPEQIEKAKRWCELIGIPHAEVGGVEADDTMGSIATLAKEKGYTVFLCTGDKDLCQLVDESIFVLNTWKENLILDAAKVEELYGVPPAQIIDYLAIVGDTSDNIPGLSGFGPKTAVPLLKEFGSLENLLNNPTLVKGEKKQKTLVEERDIALLSYRLATIHKDIEFSFDETFFSKKVPPDIASLKAFYSEQGFNSLIKELDKDLGKDIEQKEEIKENYHTVDDDISFQNLLTKLKAAKDICFDVETTDLRPLVAKLVGIGFALNEGEAYYVPLNGNLGKETVLVRLKPLFEDPSLFFYGHNIKYDAHVLQNEGITLSNISFDTILASYILNSASRKHSLDHLALHYFEKTKITIKSLIGSGKKEITMNEVPIEKVATYACEDADYTFRLKKVLEKELSKRKLESLLFEVELPLSKVLTKMERTGIFVDLEHLKKMSGEVALEISILENQIYGLADHKFNLNSPKQLSEVLFEKMGLKSLKKTATGHSTNADVLEVLSVTHPIAKKILEYRSLEKLRSTYIDSLPLDVNTETFRIHPTFNQSVAATGRLSCQDPNLQNIPVRTALGRKIREAFRPQKPGWSFLAADYSQMELRLLAHLSGDQELLKAFQNKEDIHTYTASLVFNIPLNQVSSTQRHQAKAINFGIIYGQQAYGLSQELGIDVHQANAFIAAYFERYPQVLLFIKNVIEEAKKTGKSVTMIGRERDLPEINSSNAIIRSASERLAINTPLQGSAADIIKLAMIEIDKLLLKKKMRSLMCLQIHDELLFEVPDEEIDELTKLVKQTMENVVELRVPLTVDVKVGKNWGTC